VQKTSYGLVVATVLGLLSFATPNLAQAATYTINFSLSGLSFGASQDPVTGSFSYTAAAPAGPIQSLTDIDLTIDGHAYTLGEVSFLEPVFTDFTMIFGTLNGDEVAQGTNDFYLIYNPLTLALFGSPGFFYATANDAGHVFSASAGELSRSELGQVPLPGAVVLFGSGLGLMGLLVRRRRRSKASA
jgi:hypothetical protein